MTIIIPPGSTSQSLWFKLLLDTGKDNATPLVYNSTGLVATYKRDDGAAVTIALTTLVSATAAFSAGGFIYDSVGGLYRLDVPDAAWAAGATRVTVNIPDATNINAAWSYVVTLDATVGSRLAPTTSGRTLAVDANGAVPANNVPASPTYPANFSSLAIDTTGRVDLTNVPNATAVAAITTATAAAILTNPTYKLTTDVNGKVTAKLAAADVTGNLPGVVNAYATGLAPDNADIATAITDLSALIARSDTSGNVTAIKTVTDNLAAMIVGQAFRGTALVNVPGGGSGGGTVEVTLVDQTSVING